MQTLENVVILSLDQYNEMKQASKDAAETKNKFLHLIGQAKDLDENCVIVERYTGYTLQDTIRSLFGNKTLDQRVDYKVYSKDESIKQLTDRLKVLNEVISKLKLELESKNNDTSLKDKIIGVKLKNEVAATIGYGKPAKYFIQQLEKEGPQGPITGVEFIAANLTETGMPFKILIDFCTKENSKP